MVSNYRCLKSGLLKTINFSTFSLFKISKRARMLSSSHFTILYGSQTGQAQAIAEEIHENSTQNGLRSKLFCLSQTEKKFTLENEPLVVFVVSTTGEGDPPDTMAKFMRRLKKKTLPRDHLKACQYTLLALGDTNYTNFCNNGKNLDRRLLAVGAKQFYKTGYADDAVGLEVVVDPWIDGLWNAVKQCLGLESINNESPEHSVESSSNTTSDHSTTNGTSDHDSLNSTENRKSNHESGNGTMNGTSDHESGNGTMNGTSDHESGNSTKNGTNIPKVESTLQSNQLNKELTVEHLEQNTTTEKTRSNTDDIMTKNKTTDNMGTPAIDIKSNTTENKEVLCNSKAIQSTLRKSIEPLSTSALSIPLLPARYLVIKYNDPLNTPQNKEHTSVHSKSFSMATISSARTLTTEDSVKTAIEIELNTTDCGLEYEPGDSFDIICSNNEQEVDQLINLLGLQDKADVPFEVSVMSSTTKKVANKPDYIPNGCTIRNALQHCLEIRAVPKKAMLRTLVEYTGVQQEKRRLQELCSKQGTADYQAFIRQPSTSLLELLKAFPSCHPPFECILEQLPQLSPRPYSVSSSPLMDPNKLKFVFNITEFPPFEDVRNNRLGVCTGWLSEATSSMREKSSLVNGMMKMQLQDQDIQVCVATRKKTEFRLPKDPKTPIIMIGPGTGVAPFIGFLEQRECEGQGQDPKEVFGPMWLFYGCRNRDKDYLYKEKLSSYCSSGLLTNLLVAFSRDKDCTTHYVQDSLRLYSKEVVQLLQDNAVVYVCGDAQNMAKDVFATFCDILERQLAISKVDAVQEMMKLKAKKQYHEDVWT